MTRATKTKHYPQQLLDLAEKLMKDPATVVEITFADKKDARDFLLEFYSFRACAESEGLLDLYPDLPAITMKVVKGPESTVIKVMHKDYTPTALALKQALERTK